METIYFQPKGINPKYCEVGTIHESDPEYIWYLEEPCKVLISEVKIIPKENVTYDEKKRSYLVKSASDGVTSLNEIQLEPVHGSTYCQYSVIEQKLAILYHNQEKILQAIKLIGK